MWRLRSGILIYTQQKLLSHIDYNDVRVGTLPIYTQQKLLSHIDILNLWAKLLFIYTQQKLLSHIDYSELSSQLQIIYTQQKLLSHIDGAAGGTALQIYTQQKLLSHIDLRRKQKPRKIYTQQKLLSHIDIGKQVLMLIYLHIVEITQSYRLRFRYVRRQHLHIVEITQSYRLDTGIVQFLLIYTQQKLLSHIDGPDGLSDKQNLHIVEITQSYRPGERIQNHLSSTHSRNYLVIQTAGYNYEISFIYTQQKLLSHIDRTSTSTKSPYLHIVEITQSYRLPTVEQSSSIYTQQKLLSHIDALSHGSVRPIYTQQKLLSHIDHQQGMEGVYYLHIVEITQSYRLIYRKL